MAAVDIRGNLIGSGVDNNIINEFRGFMIQARPSADGPAFGAFRLLPNDDKSKLFGCPDNATFVRINSSASAMSRIIDDFVVFFVFFVEYCFS